MTTMEVVQTVDPVVFLGRDGIRFIEERVQELLDTGFMVESDKSDPEIIRAAYDKALAEYRQSDLFMPF